MLKQIDTRGTTTWISVNDFAQLFHFIKLLYIHPAYSNFVDRDSRPAGCHLPLHSARLIFLL